MLTFKGGITKTQIDYFLIKVNNRRLFKDCKVIPNECLGTQKLLVMDVVIKSYKRKKRSVGASRVRWWNLTRESTTKLLEKIQAYGNWNIVEDANVV